MLQEKSSGLIQFEGELECITVITPQPNNGKTGLSRNGDIKVIQAMPRLNRKEREEIPSHAQIPAKMHHQKKTKTRSDEENQNPNVETNNTKARGRKNTNMGRTESPVTETNQKGKIKKQKKEDT